MPNSQAGAPWVIIPLRSPEVHSGAMSRKNLRALAGKSLLARAVETAKAACPGAVAGAQVLVVVEDSQSAEAASRLDVIVVQLAKLPDSYPEVVRSVADRLRALGALDGDSVIVLDPSLALIASARLLEAHRALQQQFTSVSLEHRGLGVPGFTAAKLSGFSSMGNTALAPTLTIEVTEPESVFINSQTDWAVANFFASRLRILIRTEVTETLEQSHAMRALGLADGLGNHVVSIVISSKEQLSKDFFAGAGVDVIEIDDDLDLLTVARKEDADLVVLDIGLNTAEFVALLNGFCKVVTVEDFGVGAEQADLALNAMFDNTQIDLEHQLSGAEVQVIPSDFESVPMPMRFSPVVKELVVCISGPDLYNLTAMVLRALDSISFDGPVTVIRGLGSELVDPSAYRLKLKVLSNVKQYAPIFKSADLAIASADYALPMLCAAGVPTLALAQNTQELLNTQARFNQGVLTLGLGSLLSEETLAAHIDRLIEDAELRQALHERALKTVGVRSNAKVANRLLRIIGF